jgi:hypothetical protein
MQGQCSHAGILCEIRREARARTAESPQNCTAIHALWATSGQDVEVLAPTAQTIDIAGFRRFVSDQMVDVRAGLRHLLTAQLASGGGCP